jgi:3-mercaptopyruvate sulfurtransferase SseA
MNNTTNTITAMRDELSIICSLKDFYSQDNVRTVKEVVSFCRSAMRASQSQTTFYEVRNLLAVALNLQAKQEASA